MKCLDMKPKLGFFLDKQLSAQEFKEISNHLQQCNKCLAELESVKKVDSLMKFEIYEEPAPEYWKSLPKTITKRIGLRTQPSKIQTLLNILNEQFVVKNLRWGGAVAAILFVTIFGINKLLKINNNNSQVTLQNSDLIRTQKDTLKNEPLELQTSSALAVKENRAKNMTTLDSLESKKKLNPIAANVPKSPNEMDVNQIVEVKVSPDLFNVIAKNSRFEKLNIRSQKLVQPDYKKELIPMPYNDSFQIIDMLANSEEEEISIHDRKTYSLQNKSRTSKISLLANTTENKDHEKSSFSETLWIVQESKSLSEKRNIWLSYLNWEKEQTYRSLGIYNLALVLSKIAEQTRDLSKTREALTFYQENEESLRFQMGDSRYKLKIAIFEKILDN